MQVRLVPFIFVPVAFLMSFPSLFQTPAIGNRTVQVELLDDTK
jgi:hypothetical protein